MTTTSEAVVQHPAYDIEVMKGADETFTFQYLDDNDQPIDISGYTAKLQIRDRFGGTLHLTLTNGSGITITGASGQVAVAFTHAQTIAFDFKHAYYDLWIISAGSVYTSVAHGKFDVIEAVTEW